FSIHRPQYRRISAFQGDFYFQGPCRHALSFLTESTKLQSVTHMHCIVTIPSHSSLLQSGGATYTFLE
ncbi:hypothetical protein SERLA73DRAFT_50653, partial [Serpula lacrymans var. lacrymans S7.3]